MSHKKCNKKMTPIPRNITKNGQTSGARHFPIDIVFNDRNNEHVANGNERSSNGIGVSERLVKSNTDIAKTDTRKLPGNGIYDASANHNASAIDIPDIPSTSRKSRRVHSHHTRTMFCSSHKCSQANECSTLVCGTGESTVFEKTQNVCGTRESTVFDKPLERVKEVEPSIDEATERSPGGSGEECSVAHKGGVQIEVDKDSIVVGGSSSIANAATAGKVRSMVRLTEN